MKSICLSLVLFLVFGYILLPSPAGAQAPCSPEDISSFSVESSAVSLPEEQIGQVLDFSFEVSNQDLINQRLTISIQKLDRAVTELQVTVNSNGTGLTSLFIDNSWINGEYSAALCGVSEIIEVTGGVDPVWGPNNCPPGDLVAGCCMWVYEGRQPVITDYCQDGYIPYFPHDTGTVGSTCICRREDSPGRPMPESVLQSHSDILCYGRSGVRTALGCIRFNSLTELTKSLLGFGIGLGGGIALILVVLAGFIIMVSSGDKKKLQTGKSLLIAAITGLLLIIFSVFILRIIGVNILGLF